MNSTSPIGLSIIAIIFGIAFGQQPIVKKIEFIGQNKTKNYVIKREILHAVDVPLDSSLAIADKQRLENLGIFSIVAMQVFNYDSNEVVLRYTLIESWRYFPMITPVYNEKWDWSVGAMLLINNFRGRNESFSVQGQYGGQNTFGIEYFNPWIIGNHISLQVGAGNDKYRHTFLPYDINSNHLNLGFGKYINYKIRTKLGLNIDDRTYSNDDSEIFDRYIVPFINIKIDTRDLYDQPRTGIEFTNTILFNIDINDENNDQTIWDQSSSYFKELIGGEINTVVGLNFTSRLSFSKNRDVWYDYIGGAYTVRGWNVPNNKLYTKGDQSYRFGMSWITASMEIRQTIIPKFATKYNNEFGLSIAAFADIGTIENNISDLIQQSPLIGVGIGIRIPWPVIKSFRLDYGWSFYHGKYVEQALHIAFGEKF